MSSRIRIRVCAMILARKYKNRKKKREWQNMREMQILRTEYFILSITYVDTTRSLRFK